MVFIYTFMHLLKLESFQDNVVRYIVGILTHKKGEKEDNSDRSLISLSHWINLPWKPPSSRLLGM